MLSKIIKAMARPKKKEVAYGIADNEIVKKLDLFLNNK